MRSNWIRVDTHKVTGVFIRKRGGIFGHWDKEETQKEGRDQNYSIINQKMPKIASNQKLEEARKKCLLEPLEETWPY